MKLRAILLLSLAVALLGIAAAGAAATGRAGPPPVGAGLTLRGGGYVLAPAATACQTDLTGFRKPVRSPAIASGGAYRLAAPAAPADTSGCCCKGYLPILRR